MAGARETGAQGRSDPPAPGARNGGTVSAAERRGLLERTVHDLTRESRASVRSQGEFDALLVRGRPVSHRLHFVAVAVLAVLALAVSEGLRIAPLGLTMVVPGLYAAYWLFLAATGGEELDRISVDERGKLGSARSGRAVETRGDFLRVAIPALVIAVSGCIAVWLIDMIVFPPPPICSLPPSEWPEHCFTMPGFLGSSGGGLSGALSVQDTQRLETFVRAFFLTVDLAFLLPATWFLWCMLTGRRVVDVRPLSRHRSDD